MLILAKAAMSIMLGFVIAMVFGFFYVKFALFLPVIHFAKENYWQKKVCFLFDLQLENEFPTSYLTNLFPAHIIVQRQLKIKLFRAVRQTYLRIVNQHEE